MRRISLIISLALVVLLLGATTVYAQNMPASDSQVTMKNFAFQPGTVTIAKGGTVTWTNQDSAPHTVSFAGQSSSTIGAGQTYTKSFSDAGTYDYICNIHPSMKGQVIVT
jgi:plastocyanin